MTEVESIKDPYRKIWAYSRLKTGQKWGYVPQKSTITQAIVDFCEKSKIVLGAFEGIFRVIVDFCNKTEKWLWIVTHESLSTAPLKFYYISTSIPFRRVKVSFPSVPIVAFSTRSNQSFPSKMSVTISSLLIVWTSPSSSLDII